MIILLSYDLNGHERPEAYEDAKKMIVKYATSYKKPLYSQQFIETDETVQTWHGRMKEIADSNDKWFINCKQHDFCNSLTGAGNVLFQN